MPTNLHTILVNAANGGSDLPASVNGRFKDIPAGTRALLTLLRGSGGEADMIHVT